VTKLNSNEWWFGPLFRIAGYALLALSLFDIVDIFIPVRFTNAAWEFQIVRNLVERAPVPLLGLVLVLSSAKSSRIVKFLSWSSLVVGILFLLLIPLGVSSSWRLAQQNQQQLTTQLNQQTAQLQQVQDVLAKATTAQEINSVLSRLNPQGRPPAINNPEQVKSQLLSQLTQARNRALAQAEASRTSARQVLIRNAVKSLLGALVCGVVFLSIWRITGKMLRS
jgi:hypothetical protein